MDRYHQPQRSPPLRLRRHPYQLPFPPLSMSSWQPPPFRPSRRWVRWGDTLHEIQDLAIALGVDRLNLREWLDSYLEPAAPPDGGLLRGQPCRWGTDQELLDFELNLVTNPPQPSSIQVKWKHPDGTTERIPLEQAAARIIQGNCSVNPLDLRVALKQGPQHYRGHRIELINAQKKQQRHISMEVTTSDFAPMPTPVTQEQRDGEKEGEPVQAMTGVCDTDGGEERPRKRGGRRPRAVMVGGRWCRSISEAAEVTGLPRPTLNDRLASSPEGFEHDGQIVRYACDADRPSELSTSPVSGPAVQQREKTARKQQAGLGEAARELLLQTAEAAGVTPDEAVLALLPPSPTMAAVLDAVDRHQPRPANRVGLGEVDGDRPDGGVS